jgi:TATA-box binding protein (TBP) (component of TFIID and TFIIIB)
MKQPKIVLLIFVSGKIVLTGAKVLCQSSCQDELRRPELLNLVTLHLISGKFWSKSLVSYMLTDSGLLQVRDEIYEAFENIYPVLSEFRKIQQW